MEECSLQLSAEFVRLFYFCNYLIEILLLKTAVYPQSINTENYYLIRLPLARNAVFIPLSIISITWLIVLFGIFCTKLFTLWEDDINVSSVMFLLVVSFRISMFTKWKIYSIRFKLGLWGGIQNTKAPISSYSVLAASEFSMGHPSWRIHFALGLALLSNMEGKCSRAIFVIVAPDNLPKYCSHRITPLL